MSDAAGHRAQRAKPLLLDHLLLRLFRSERSLHLPDGAPSKWRALADFLKFTEPGLRYDVATGDDMRPWLYELRRWASDLFESHRTAHAK